MEAQAVIHSFALPAVAETALDFPFHGAAVVWLGIDMSLR